MIATHMPVSKSFLQSERDEWCEFAGGEKIGTPLRSRTRMRCF